MAISAYSFQKYRIKCRRAAREAAAVSVNDRSGGVIDADENPYSIEDYEVIDNDFVSQQLSLSSYRPGKFARYD